MNERASLPWVWSPDYEVDIGMHVFPTVKYRRVKDRLLGEGTLSEEDLRTPEPADRNALSTVHSSEYLERFLTGSLTPADELQLELPSSPGLIRAARICCQGTLLTSRLALEHGVAAHLGGGFHHAFAGHGEGFCPLNDVAVAAAVLKDDCSLARVAVVDLDVHHGNGTAHIFRQEPAIFTFSMHQERNYPHPKRPGDLDVGLEDGLGDEAYLGLVRQHLPTVLAHEPGLVIYLAGADPYHDDQLGGLSLSRDGLRERDRTVLETFRSAGVPVAVVLAGGYALRQDDTIEIHCSTVRECARFA